MHYEGIQHKRQTFGCGYFSNFKEVPTTLPGSVSETFALTFDTLVSLLHTIVVGSLREKWRTAKKAWVRLPVTKLVKNNRNRYTMGPFVINEDVPNRPMLRKNRGRNNLMVISTKRMQNF